MNYKPFSKKDYIENDIKAREIALKFLLWDGRFEIIVPLKDQPEQYKKFDFFVTHKKTGDIIKVETERKIKGWAKQGKWEGWNTLDIPYRKKDSEADIFIMHNSFWNTLAVIMMKKVKDSTVNQKNAKCSNVKTNKESFFNVSLKDVRFFKAINENKTEWVEISENGNLI